MASVDTSCFYSPPLFYCRVTSHVLKVIYMMDALCLVPVFRGCTGSRCEVGLDGIV